MSDKNKLDQDKPTPSRVDYESEENENSISSDSNKNPTINKAFLIDSVTSEPDAKNTADLAVMQDSNKTDTYQEEDDFEEKDENPHVVAESSSSREKTADPQLLMDLKTAKLQDLLINLIDKRVKTITTQLKDLLQGTLILNIKDTRKNFSFYWANNCYKIDDLSDKSTTDDSENQKDCVISLTEKSLKDVVSGDLNPQLAIISGKIIVSGKFSMAIYFFNLLAPK